MTERQCQEWRYRCAQGDIYVHRCKKKAAGTFRSGEFHLDLCEVHLGQLVSSGKSWYLAADGNTMEMVTTPKYPLEDCA